MQNYLYKKGGKGFSSSKISATTFRTITHQHPYKYIFSFLFLFCYTTGFSNISEEVGKKGFFSKVAKIYASILLENVENTAKMRSIPSVCTNNILSNASFENTGTATFASTFQGCPAEPLPEATFNSILPNWNLDYSCGVCDPGYWIDDSANKV
ncbi:MAG: hypothetical protein AAGJ18_23160, partial [Bacteroidota bacterium]